jgi:hypothetical protein
MIMCTLIIFIIVVKLIDLNTSCTNNYKNNVEMDKISFSVCYNGKEFVL